MLPQGVGKGGAPFDVFLDGADDPGKGLVLFLGGQDVEALDERKTCADHRRELAGKDDDFLPFDAPPEGDHFQEIFRLFFYAGRFETLPAELCSNGRLIDGFRFAFFDLAGPSLGYPNVNCHNRSPRFIKCFRLLPDCREKSRSHTCPTFHIIGIFPDFLIPSLPGHARQGGCAAKVKQNRCHGVEPGWCQRGRALRRIS